MAIALVAHTGIASPDNQVITTPAIDTTGATLLVMVVSEVTSLAGTKSDSKGNTWGGGYALNAGGGNPTLTIYWLDTAPLVGAGHTFSAGVQAAQPALCVAAFSGTAGADNVTGNANAGSATIAVASGYTPAQNNSVLISAVGSQGGGIPAITAGGLTVTDAFAFNSGNSFGLGMAYLIQGTAANWAATWSVSGGNSLAIVMLAVSPGAVVAGGVGGLLGSTRNRLIQEGGP